MDSTTDAEMFPSFWLSKELKPEFSSQYSWEKGPSSNNVSPRNTGILLLILNSLSSA